MTDLISQLFDIATNDEFSPEQRKLMMEIALSLWIELDKAEQEPPSAPSLTLNIDESLGRSLTKETLPNGGIRFGLASHLPTD